MFSRQSDSQSLTCRRDSCVSANQQLQPPFDICDEDQYSPEGSLEHVPALVHSIPSSAILQTQVVGDGESVHGTDLIRGSTIPHVPRVAARSASLPYQSSVDTAALEGARFHHHVLPRLATSRRSSVESQDNTTIEGSPSNIANSATPTTAATCTYSDQFGSPRPWSPENYQTKRRESQTPALQINPLGAIQNRFRSPTIENKAGITTIRRPSYVELDNGHFNGGMQDGNSPSILPCATTETASVHPACNSGIHYGWQKPLEFDGDGVLGFVPTAGKTGPRLPHHPGQSTHDHDLRCCDHNYHQSQWNRANWAFLQFQNQCSWGAPNGMHDYDMAGYPPSYLFGGTDEQQLSPWQSEILPYNAWQWH